MEVNNRLGWNEFIFRQYNSRAELNIVLTTFRVFDIIDGCKLNESEDDQREALLKDEYIGDAPLVHLFRQADFVPFKPGTDVTAIAQAWAPNGEAQKSWLVELSIARKKETIEKQLRIYGSRKWDQKAGGNWVLTEPESASCVPLDYFRAFGGEKIDEPIVEGAPRNCNIYNPVGPGVIENKKYKPETPFFAPQIEDPNEPILSPMGDYVPQGFAPIAPVWRFRQQYTGTFDQEWLNTHHPFLPENFNYQFYNCAHPDLIVKPYINRHDTIKALNLHPYHKQIEFSMPDVTICAQCTYRNGETKLTFMNVDGVHLELLQTVPKVRLTWRGSFAWRSGIEKIEIGRISESHLQQALTERAAEYE